MVCGMFLGWQTPTAHGQNPLIGGKGANPFTAKGKNGNNTMSPQARMLYTQLVGWFTKYQKKDGEHPDGYWGKTELARAFGYTRAFDDTPGLKKPMPKDDDKDLVKDPESLKNRKTSTSSNANKRRDELFKDAVDTNGDDLIDRPEFLDWAQGYAMAQAPNRPMVMPNRMPYRRGQNPYRGYGRRGNGNRGYGNGGGNGNGNRGMGGVIVASNTGNRGIGNRSTGGTANRSMPARPNRNVGNKNQSGAKKPTNKSAVKKPAAKPAARKAPPRRAAPARKAQTRRAAPARRAPARRAAPARRGGGGRRR
jgi:hypothetical protein